MGLPSFRRRALKLVLGLRLHLGNRRSLWLLLAGLLFLWNTALLWLNQAPLTFQCLNLLLWLGILISLEDQLQSLWPKPSRFSAFLGSWLLALVIVRGSLITNLDDKFLSLAPPLLILGLGLLNRPIADWGLFNKAILITSLWLFYTPVVLLLSWSLGPIASKLAAHLTWFLLYLLGFNASLSGQIVQLGSGSVGVIESCAGLEQITFLLFVALIFLAIFPMQKKKNILLILFSSFPIAFACNIVRLSLLAYFTSWPNSSGLSLFHFFHDSAGSQIFSLISASFFGYFYLLTLDRELRAS